MFEQNLKNWVEKVINAYNSKDKNIIDTYKIMIDVDKIISNGFEREPMFDENK